MRKIAFDDQREKLAYLLDNHVPVLIYHGIFDMIIPISSTLRTINNTNWKRRDQWMTRERNPYYYTNANGIRELMGYNQSGGGLDFVLVLNSGHMVPIDQPSWSLKILEDFIINSQSVTRNRRDLNSDAGDFQKNMNKLKMKYSGEKCQSNLAPGTVLYRKISFLNFMF